MLGKRLRATAWRVSGAVLATALCQNAASACVPGPLVVSTVQAATLMAAGKTLAAGAISAKVVALTEGVLKAMLMTKLKVALAVVLTLNLIGAGVGLVYCQTAGSGQDKQGKPALAQEKPNVPVPAGQQPAPKKEAKESQRGAADRLSENGSRSSLETAGAGRQSVDDERHGQWQKGLRLASANALGVFRRFELRGVPRSLPPLGPWL